MKPAHHDTLEDKITALMAIPAGDIHGADGMNTRRVARRGVLIPHIQHVNDLQFRTETPASQFMFYPWPAGRFHSAGGLPNYRITNAGSWRARSCLFAMGSVPRVRTRDSAPYEQPKIPTSHKTRHQTCCKGITATRNVCNVHRPARHQADVLAGFINYVQLRLVTVYDTTH